MSACWPASIPPSLAGATIWHQSQAEQPFYESVANHDLSIVIRRFGEEDFQSEDRDESSSNPDPYQQTPLLPSLDFGASFALKSWQSWHCPSCPNWRRQSLETRNGHRLGAGIRAQKSPFHCTSCHCRCFWLAIVESNQEEREREKRLFKKV